MGWKRAKRGPDMQYMTEEAINPNTSADRLEQLAAEPDRNVRRNVACNLNTPAHVLGQLAGGPYQWVRDVAAGSPNTPGAAPGRCTVRNRHGSRDALTNRLRGRACYSLRCGR